MKKINSFIMIAMLPLALLFLSGCWQPMGNSKAKQPIAEKDKNRVFLYQAPSTKVVYLLTFEQLNVAGVKPGAIEGLQEIDTKVNYDQLAQKHDNVDLSKNQKKE
jgi:hypothetical protein